MSKNIKQDLQNLVLDYADTILKTVKKITPQTINQNMKLYKKELYDLEKNVELTFSQKRKYSNIEYN